jgi:hypothetical protein
MTIEKAHFNIILLLLLFLLLSTTNASDYYSPPPKCLTIYSISVPPYVPHLPSTHSKKLPPCIHNMDTLFITCKSTAKKCIPHAKYGDITRVNTAYYLIGNFIKLQPIVPGTQFLTIQNNNYITDLSSLVTTNLVGLTITSCPSLKQLNFAKTSLNNTLRVVVINNNNNVLDLTGMELFTTLDWLELDLNQNMKSLNGLNHITTIQKQLTISNLPHLTSLTGLEKLSQVNFLHLGNLSSLTTLSALQNLEKTGFDYGLLDIVDCPLLQNLNGLNNLASVSSMFISNALSLTNINALSKLTTARYLMINSCPLLHNLQGLSALSKVETLTLQNLPSLESTSGLGNLKTFESISITNCSRLQSLQSFNSVVQNTKKGSLSLQLDNVPLLKTLDGLTHLTFMVIELMNNIVLTTDILPKLSLIPGATLKLSNMNSLKTLVGLEYLQSLDTLIISHCPNIKKLDGLDNLKSVINDYNHNHNGGFLQFMYLDSLSSLIALKKLSAVGSLTISGCPQLTSFQGLNQLAKAGSVEISDCPKIKDLKGLTSLNSGTEFKLLRLDGLISLSGLDHMEQIPYNRMSLTISNNNNLESLTGFPPKINQLDTLYISDNINLKSLDGLLNITDVWMLTLKDPGGSELVDLSGLKNLANSNLGDSQLHIKLTRKSNLNSIMDLGTPNVKFWQVILEGLQTYSKVSLSQIKKFMKKSCSTNKVIHDNKLDKWQCGG